MNQTFYSVLGLFGETWSAYCGSDVVSRWTDCWCRSPERMSQGWSCFLLFSGRFLSTCRHASLRRYSQPMSTVYNKKVSPWTPSTGLTSNKRSCLLQNISGLTSLLRRHVGNDQTSATQFTWPFIWKSRDKKTDWLSQQVTLHCGRLITPSYIGLKVQLTVTN